MLIAIIIGLAIFAFVIQDFIGSGQQLRGRARFNLAEIDGQTIHYQDYMARVDRLSEYYRLRMGNSNIDPSTMDNIRQQTWQDIVREYTTKKEYKELGINVSDDELMDMVTGRDPHPIIRSIFSDPQTGVLNRSMLLQFIRTMDQDPSGQQKTIWLFLEDEITKDRRFKKFNDLISQGMYVTDLEAKSRYKDANRKVDFSFVMKRYNTVPDSLVSYRESDLQSYYKKHENDYKQDASADLEYIVFEVKPTPADDQAASDWINSMVDDMENEEDAASLVNFESDVPYDDLNHTYDELSDSIRDFMFSADVGDVYGPYSEDGAYRIARLMEINHVPDSVRARHILIRPSQNTNQEAAKSLADSLKTAIENGSDFAALARQYSADGSASQGGDLGWFTEGAMVKPISDACFEGNIGEVQVVQSQFGYHVIQVLNQSPDVKKVKVAILSKKVEPSSATYQEVYSRAIAFAGKNDNWRSFNSAAKDSGLTIRYADEVRKNQKNITGLESSREMIRWAFKAEPHDVSDVFEFSNNYVVAALREKREEGIAPLEQVRSEIEQEVKKEKKADRIVSDFNEHIRVDSSFENLASDMGLDVREASQISFNSVSVPVAGIEPKLIAVATSLQEGRTSAPVKGINGVYVVRVNRVSNAAGDPLSDRDRLTTMLKSQANFEAYNALQEACNIKDNRSNFF